MTRRPDQLLDRASILADEVERFASFDLETRRFIAYALSLVPELQPIISREEGTAGNAPRPLEVGVVEATERTAAYAQVAALRNCTGKGWQGQNQRRLNFALLLEPARVDLKWKRLTTLPAFIFCYERLVGPAWRELLPLAWKESVLQRRKKAPPRQIPLDARLISDDRVPARLEDDPAPWFFPNLADAERAGGAPLLSLL